MVDSLKFIFTDSKKGVWLNPLKCNALPSSKASSWMMRNLRMAAILAKLILGNFWNEFGPSEPVNGVFTHRLPIF